LRARRARLRRFLFAQAAPQRARAPLRRAAPTAAPRRSAPRRAAPRRAAPLLPLRRGRGAAAGAAMSTSGMLQAVKGFADKVKGERVRARRGAVACGVRAPTDAPEPAS
jgi:hypothetical protein